MRSLFLNRLVVINGLVALWVTLFANHAFFTEFMQFSGKTGVSYVGLYMLTFCLLFALHNLFLQWLTWWRFAKPLLVILLLISALTAYCVDAFGVGIDPSQIENALQTNTKEAGDLVNFHSWMYLIFMGILPSLWVVKQKIIAESFVSRLKWRFLASLVSFCLIVISAFFYYVDYAAIFREHRTLSYKISPENTISSFIRYTSRNFQAKPLPLVLYGADAHKATALPNTKPTLMVLVVGETSRGESFSLNGYARNTNPELTKQHVINFSQASSCGTATAVSLPCMFSGMTRNDYDAKLASHREGLLDVLQRAGYEVTWIENQMGCKKTCDRVKNEPTDDKNPEYCVDEECWDGLALEKLKDYLKQSAVKDRVIVVHAMGSHGPAYYKRYPKAFEVFKPVCPTNNIQSCTQQQIINTYDNTIVYEDYVLARMIDVLKGQADNYQTAFWYNSDHGESTGEKGLYLHGAPYFIAPSQQTHIPMLAWVSPSFKESNANKVSCLEKSKNTSTGHDNLFHTMLGLLNVSTSVYDRSLDLSACAL